MNRFMPPAFQQRSIGDDPEHQPQRAADNSKRAKLTAAPAPPKLDDIDTAAKRIRRLEAEVRRYEAQVARSRAERGLVDDYDALKIVAMDLGLVPETLRTWVVDGEVDARHRDLDSAQWQVSRSSAAARKARMTPSS